VRLRWRFTVWFLITALVPIAAAALGMRHEVSRSYRDEFARLRTFAEKTAQGELSRRADAVARAVEAMATRKHDFVGGLLIELDKSGGVVLPMTRRRLERRAGALMRGLGLDILFLTDGANRVLVAPHYRAAVGEAHSRHSRRAARLKGAAYYTSEPTIKGGKVRQLLVVESARTVRDGAHQVTVVGGRVIGHELLEAVRLPGSIDARIVDAKGNVLAAATENWKTFSESPPFRLPLAGPDGEPVAWIEVTISDAELHRTLRSVSLLALGLAGAALLVTTLLAFWVARRMTRDLDRLVEGAQAASRGDLDHRVEVKARDEIGAVADSFNDMMDDLRTSKQRLVIAERIAAWQEIARRLAHEIKNPLTPIQMSVETLRKTYEKKHPSFEETFEESTATVLEETARLKRIVSEFSDFARLPKPVTGPCDLNELVSSALSLYQGTVQITKDLADGLPEIMADKDQLSQVILNLLENSRDAISLRPDPEGGRILVETHLVNNGNAVQLIVDDNGPGIAAELRDKLFTPYFTTKHGAGGTGLGLAIVHRIVSDHDGTIIAGDAPAGGARFTVTLPVEH
jgi:signal transduction histidine kinase